MKNISKKNANEAASILAKLIENLPINKTIDKNTEIELCKKIAHGDLDVELFLDYVVRKKYNLSKNSLTIIINGVTSSWVAKYILTETMWRSQISNKEVFWLCSFYVFRKLLLWTPLCLAALVIASIWIVFTPEIKSFAVFLSTVILVYMAKKFYKKFFLIL